MKTTLLSFTLLTLGTCDSWAGSVCPAGSGANPFPHSPDAAGTGCNVLITINADRTTTVTITDPVAYEVSEDVMVGVRNNSASNVPSLGLTGTNIFGLEGDGICTYTFVGSGYCTANQMAGVDPGDYYGPSSTYVITNNNTGTVNFSPAITPGGTTYFSLEGVPSANLNITVAPPTSGPIGTPALSLGALAGLAAMMTAFALWAIWSKRREQEQE